MEHFLDILWEYIYSAILAVTGFTDSLLTPIHNATGPAFVLILLAFLTVCLTKFLSKHCRTKRHVKLEEDFHHWLGVREEAMRCEDREKGSRMARNIDQAKLNRCYYDYFLEGLLLGFATTYFPIFMMMSYVNSYYRPERLLEISGKEYVVQLGSTGGEPLLIGSIFFYFVALISFYLSWAILKKVFERQRQKQIINEINSQQAITAQ